MCDCDNQYLLDAIQTAAECNFMDKMSRLWMDSVRAQLDAIGAPDSQEIGSEYWDGSYLEEYFDSCAWRMIGYGLTVAPDEQWDSELKKQFWPIHEERLDKSTRTMLHDYIIQYHIQETFLRRMEFDRLTELFPDWEEHADPDMAKKLLNRERKEDE